MRMIGLPQNSGYRNYLVSDPTLPTFLPNRFYKLFPSWCLTVSAECACVYICVEELNGVSTIALLPTDPRKNYLGVYHLVFNVLDGFPSASSSQYIWPYPAESLRVFVEVLAEIFIHNL